MRVEIPDSRIEAFFEGELLPIHIFNVSFVCFIRFLYIRIAVKYIIEL